MELNGFTIESIGMLKENFLPFWGVWKNVEIGLYQECMRMYFGEDELTPEILSVSAWVWDERTERPFKRVHQVKYQDFAENNREQMGSLEKAAKNEKQKGILYLCVLMHIHARHSSLVPETETFISRLLAEREETGLLEERDVKEGDCSPKRLNIYRQQFGIVGEEAYYLDGNGRIVSLRGGSLLPLASDMEGLRSFAYTDTLGLIAVTHSGQVQARGGADLMEFPSGIKMVSVSAYLSSYMLLDENGTVHTNIDMDLSQWTNLRYIYVGLNSAVGVKRGKGNVVTVGMRELPAFTAVAKMYTYHGRERHYIALFDNGEIRDDEGGACQNVTAAAICDDGYFYALKTGEVYWRNYGQGATGESEFYGQAKGQVKEMLIAKGQVFMLL